MMAVENAQPPDQPRGLRGGVRLDDFLDPPLSDEANSFIESAEILAEPWRERIAQLTAERDSLRGVVQAVEALHQPGESIIVWVYDPNGTEPVSTRPARRCDGCSESGGGLHDHLVEWPCATYLAVRPDTAAAADTPQAEPATRCVCGHDAALHAKSAASSCCTESNDRAWYCPCPALRVPSPAVAPEPADPPSKP